MPDSKSITQPIGVTGLSWWRGYISEEYLNELRGTARVYKIYREMADDCTIGALLDSIIMPLLSAEFFVEPASEDKADVEAAEFFESCRDDMTGYSWRQHVLDMMSALTYGFSLGEVVLKKRNGDKGRPASHYDDGKVGIASIDPRAQTSLDHWQLDDQAHVTGFIQRDPNTGTYYEIPAEKLVHWAWRPEKRNPEGRSAMRSLYRSWYMRKNLELIEAIGIERDMAGTPMIKLPYGATKDDAAKALDIVRNMRNDEEAGIVLPAPPRLGADAAGWEFELLGGGGKQYNARETIRDYDKKILMRFFAQFLLLGMDKVGTQALVKGSQDFFALALKSIQQELLEVWNGQLIPYVFRFNNFSGLTGLPRLNWADPGKADIAGLSTLLKDMTAAQIITASAELEDHVRSVAGLPDRPEGVGEGPRAAPAPAAAPSTPFSREYGGPGSGNWGHGGRPGEIGGSGEGGGLSERAQRAKSSHKPATAEKQRAAERNETTLATAIGGKQTKDNEAFDVVTRGHCIEVKTIMEGSNDKITMHPESLARKQAEASKRGLKAHTVVFDARNNAVYYRQGIGSFRLGNMEKLSSAAAVRSRLS